MALVTQIRPGNVWQYQTFNLWISYALAISATALGVVVGIGAIYANGGSYDTTFSATMVATRSTTLDRIVVDSNVAGPHDVGGRLLDTKLMFGVLDRDTATPAGYIGVHAAFGLKGDIQKLR